MKEENHHLRHHHHTTRHFSNLFSCNRFTKASVHIFFFVVIYAFGFFSASTIREPNSRNPQQKLLRNVSSANPEPDLFRFKTQCADPVPSKVVRQTILDQIFNGSSPFDGFPPAHFRPLHRSKWNKGWGSTGPVFENLIRKVRPNTIIEIGSFLGASAIHMAELTRRVGLETQILCVDEFRGWPGFRDRFPDITMVNGDVMLMYQFMQNVAHYSHTDEILPVPFSSGFALAKLCELGVYGDLVEVDSGHDFHSMWADINRAHALLRSGGVMFGHDYLASADNKGVRRAVHLVSKVKGLRVQTYGQNWVLTSA